jgi:predicted Zn-dependent peptidase
VGAKKLLAAWDRVQGYEVEVGYVGREKPDAIAAAVRETLPLRNDARPEVPHLVYPRRVPTETTVYFVPQRGAVQTQLWFAVEGTPVQPKERPSADAFEAYFGGGMAGLVFQEVREFRALAYAAGGRYERDDEVVQRSQLLAHVGCQADKTHEAIDVMLELITKMPQRRDRIDLVRASLVRSQETDSPSFRELQDQIDEWRHEGERDDPRRHTIPAYRELEFDDIAEFYRAHVAGKPLSIMVVGDPRKVKPKDLKKYGKLVRLREWRLYSQ